MAEFSRTSMATKRIERSQIFHNNLEKITEGKENLQFRGGEKIYKQGDPADAVFFVKSGKVKITAVSPARKDATLSVRSQGDFFGMGCLSGLKGQSLRVSTATALDLSQLIRIRKAAMTRALREHLPLRQAFIDYLLTCNTNIQEDLCDQLLHPIEIRLARLLLKLAHLGGERAKAEVTIPKFSHEALSKMVGATRSRVTHFMNKFKKMGLVHYSRSLVVQADRIAEVISSE